MPHPFAILARVVSIAWETLNKLTKVVEATRLSKAAFAKIVQNLFRAWFYNLAAIPIAALGLLHPMIGVVAMTTSSLPVIGNSLLPRRRAARW